MFVVLLGYFKVKPVMLNPRFHQIKHDIKYVCSEVFPGSGLRPFNLSQKVRVRIYQRIFKMTGYQRWENTLHKSELIKDLNEHALSWSQPRSLFDMAIEYLSIKKIAIPGYTILQDLISDVVNATNNQFVTHAENVTSTDLAQMLSELVGEGGMLNLRQLRQSAKNFTGTELEKELAVHRHLQPWMSEVNSVQGALALSQKNQQQFSERVDYYGAKLKRQSEGNQRLYLLCYLQSRWHQALERIADGFIHHVRQAKHKAKAFAQESVYQDWQKAAKNVSKAAELLHLFVDDSVDQKQPFGEVRQQALKLLAAKELESVCLFLNEQKRSVDEAIWQYYDKREGLRIRLLRELFLCLRFEGSEGAQLLASVLEQARLNFLNEGGLLKAAIDRRLSPKNQLPFLLDDDDAINPDRYEWYLYLQIPSRLNGLLTLPDVIKYRALDSDLVDRKRWLEKKEQLLKQTQLPKLMAEPHRLIEQMTLELDNRLHAVSDHLEQADNRNIILRNPKGKRLWRLPTASNNTRLTIPSSNRCQQPAWQTCYV